MRAFKSEYIKKSKSNRIKNEKFGSLFFQTHQDDDRIYPSIHSFLFHFNLVIPIPKCSSIVYAYFFLAINHQFHHHNHFVWIFFMFACPFLSPGGPLFIMAIWSR